MYTHKEMARLFQEIYKYKFFLSNIVKQNSGKAKLLERTGFTGILKIFNFIIHLWMAAQQKDKENPFDENDFLIFAKALVNEKRLVLNIFFQLIFSVMVIL